MISEKQHPLLNLRDAAYEASEIAHRRMRSEIALYRNDEYTGDSWIKRFVPSVKRSINPKITNTINRLIPVFSEQIAHINLEPMREDPSRWDLLALEELEEHLEVSESVDSESDELKTLIIHNGIMGNAVSKIVYDRDDEIVRAISINPLRFAPDPSLTRSDFVGAGYVVHTVYHSIAEVKRRFPGAKLRDRHNKKDSPLAGKIRVDEIILKKRSAMDAGIAGAREADLTVAIIVDDKPYRAWHDPLWYPSFPYAHWRNFLDVMDRGGSGQEFWGYGYASLLEPQQKLLDEFLSAYIRATRNLATGRMLSIEGAIDQEQISNSSGEIINVKRPSETNEPIGNLVQFTNAPDPPVTFLNMIQLVNQIIDDQAPSLAPVFVGEAPGASSSGRAINSLQQAVFNQLSDNVRDFNAMRERRARIRLNFIQQFSRQSVKPNRWRLGYDLPPITEEARRMPFKLMTPDVSSLPQTPAGKMQLLLMLQQLGLIIKPERVSELIGLKSAYGVSEEDLVQMGQPGMGQPGTVDPSMDMATMTGAEPVPPAER